MKETPVVSNHMEGMMGKMCTKGKWETTLTHWTVTIKKFNNIERENMDLQSPLGFADGVRLRSHFGNGLASFCEVEYSDT